MHRFFRIHDNELFLYRSANRANTCASAASDAFCVVNNGKTVDDMYCVVFASRYASSKTDTAVGTGFVAATQLFGCNAVLCALVAILILCGITVARAHYVRVERNRDLHLDTHNFADTAATLCRAGVAGIGSCLSLNDSLRQSRTSRIAASTAVRAGETFEYLLYARIALNRENA